MTSPEDVKGFNLKNHQELKNFAKLSQKLHSFFSRGSISPPPPLGDKGLNLVHFTFFTIEIDIRPIFGVFG